MKMISNRYFLFVLLVAAMLFPVSAAADGQQLNYAILGDSNTSIGGDDCSKQQGWTKWFVERVHPASCRSFARSGATWTNTVKTSYNTSEYTELLSDNNVVYNQVNRLVAAVRTGSCVRPDVIIIACGTNDAWFQSKRPGIFQKTVEQAFADSSHYITSRKVSTVTSLAESVRYVCELLLVEFPDSRVILLTPMQTVKASFEQTKRVGDVIENCGRRMSIPVIRQDYLNGVYNVAEHLHPQRTSDGTHTSVDGARRNGYFIARQVMPLLND